MPGAINSHAALRKTSLVDYPGKISAALFFPGCTLRCPWCHNPELVQGHIEDGISLDEILSFLEKRKNVLNAVVLSGGEAMLCHNLPEFIVSIKKLNLLVKLDTNGMHPEALEDLLSHHLTKPDYIALDIKVPPHRYTELTNHHSGNRENDLGKSLVKSAALIAQYSIEHEFRTLIFPNNYLSESDIEAMAELVDDSPWVFRPFVPGNCLDESWNNILPTTIDDQNPLIQRAESLGKHVVVYK